MLRRGEFNILSYTGRRTFQIENPSYCAGFFSFANVKCLACPFRVECESIAVTEFGYAGRPETIMKEYFYALPFFYRVVLPEKVSFFFSYLVPKHLPAKMRRVVRQQLRVVYKMHLYTEVFSRWEIFALEENGILNYYSKLPQINPYFEWFTDDQVKRIAFSLRSLVARTGKNAPFCIITFESSGWLSYNLKSLMAFEYAQDAFFWIDVGDAESENIRDAMRSVVDEDLGRNQIKFSLVKIPCVVVWLVSKRSFLRVLGWIKRNEHFVKYVLVLFDDHRYFKLLQCCLFPLMYSAEFTGSHFPYMALFKVIKRGKALEIRKEAVEEVLDEDQS